MWLVDQRLGQGTGALGMNVAQTRHHLLHIVWVELTYTGQCGGKCACVCSDARCTLVVAVHDERRLCGAKFDSNVLWRCNLDSECSVCLRVVKECVNTKQHISSWRGGGNRDGISWLSTTYHRLPLHSLTWPNAVLRDCKVEGNCKVKPAEDCGVDKPATGDACANS